MTILVTGGSSMAGKHLQKVLPKAIYLSSKECDLQDLEQTSKLFKQIKPQAVIHLAAKVGGIMDNIKNPVNFFDDNILFLSFVHNIVRFYTIIRRKSLFVLFLI